MDRIRRRYVVREAMMFAVRVAEGWSGCWRVVWDVGWMFCVTWWGNVEGETLWSGEAVSGNAE